MMQAAVTQTTRVDYAAHAPARRNRRRGLMLVTAIALLAALAATYVTTRTNWWVLPYARLYIPDVTMTADGRLVAPTPAR